MSNFQPLSVRRGIRPARGPYDGVPPHLRATLIHWVEAQLGFRSSHGLLQRRMMLVASAVGINLQRPSWESSAQLDEIRDVCLQDEDTFLDVIDALLQVTDGAGADELETQLRIGGSVWTVADDRKRLQHRVDPTATEAYRRATVAQDRASEELRTAWNEIYGRDPNPSDAWDHAIKAVEAALIPIVVPNKAKATLADVLGQLKASPQEWRLLLTTSSTETAEIPTVEAALRLMWPNPDRHGGTGPSRTPPPAEAEAVVQLAVLIVQWARAGFLTRT